MSFAKVPRSGEARSKDSLLNAVGKVFEIVFETVRSLNLFELVVNSQPTNLSQQNSRLQRRLFSANRPFEMNYTVKRAGCQVVNSAARNDCLFIVGLRNAT